MTTNTKDFIRLKDASPIMSMWEFFADNPLYRLMKYEPINNGIRVWYAILQ